MRCEVFLNLNLISQILLQLHLSHQSGMGGSMNFQSHFLHEGSSLIFEDVKRRLMWCTIHEVVQQHLASMWYQISLIVARNASVVRLATDSRRKCLGDLTNKCANVALNSRFTAQVTKSHEVLVQYNLLCSSKWSGRLYSHRLEFTQELLWCLNLKVITCQTLADE